MVLEFFDKYKSFSNFHLKPISYFGLVFPAIENAFMAAKTLNGEDRKKLSLMTPFEAKKIGKKVKLVEDWEEIKFKVMLEVNREKFKDGSEKELLLSAGNEYLIEANWWHDNIWGFCLGPEFKNTRTLGLEKCKICKNSGNNLLGKILMQIREEIEINEQLTGINTKRYSDFDAE